MSSVTRPSQPCHHAISHATIATIATIATSHATIATITPTTCDQSHDHAISHPTIATIAISHATIVPIAISHTTTRPSPPHNTSLSLFFFVLNHKKLIYSLSTLLILQRTLLYTYTTTRLHDYTKQYVLLLHLL
jgi:hypothetical protein